MEWKAGLLAGALAVLLPAAAHAQSPGAVDKGFYVGAGAGVNWMGDIDRRGAGDVNIDNPGWAGVLALGYDFGQFRAELEGQYYNNNPDAPFTSVETWAGMVNVLYDFDFGFPVKPHIGIGAGYAVTDADPGGDSDGAFQLQGIAGLEYAITPNIAVFADYRYVTTDLITIGNPDYEYDRHVVLAGLRFTFGQPAPKPTPVMAPPPPPPPPPPAARPAPPPPPAVARSYLVFFDFDRSNLTPEATRIVQTAAQNARSGAPTRINVTGHADRSGPTAYNQRLSQRRAESVRAELVRNGVSPSDIAVFAKGETDPLVPTPDGVREPQNRRVEIVFQ